MSDVMGDGGEGVGTEPPNWMRPAAAVDPPKVDPDAAAPPVGDEYDYYEEEDEDEDEAAPAPAAVEAVELAAQLQQLVSPVAQQQPAAGPGAAAAAAEEENEYYDDDEEEGEVGGVQAAAPAAPPPPTAQPEAGHDAAAYDYYEEEEEEEEKEVAKAEAQGAGASAADMARAEKEIFADDAAVEKFEYGGGPSEAQQKPGKKSVMKLGGIFGGKKSAK